MIDRRATTSSIFGFPVSYLLDTYTQDGTLPTLFYFQNIVMWNITF